MGECHKAAGRYTKKLEEAKAKKVELERKRLGEENQKKMIEEFEEKKKSFKRKKEELESEIFFREEQSKSISQDIKAKAESLGRPENRLSAQVTYI